VSSQGQAGPKLLPTQPCRPTALNSASRAALLRATQAHPAQVALITPGAAQSISEDREAIRALVTGKFREVMSVQRQISPSVAGDELGILPDFLRVVDFVNTQKTNGDSDCNANAPTSGTRRIHSHALQRRERHPLRGL